MIRKLSVAACAALLALAFTGCGDDDDVTPDQKDCDPACTANQTCDKSKDPPVCVNKPAPECDPACQTGFTCNKNVNPPRCEQTDCVPACEADETCDKSKKPPVCVKPAPCGAGCPAGTVCDETMDPPACVCDPACPAGQMCDTTQTPALCKEICNPPAGCMDRWEVCNEQTGACEPLSCGGNQCEFGQGCFNPATGAAGGNTCTCLPATSTRADTCAPYGKVCDFDEDQPAASTCKLPGPYEDCIESIGCEEGLECIDDGSGGWCLEPCATSLDCSDISDFCIPAGNGAISNHCYFNICAHPDDGVARFDAYFKACPTGLTGQDGTCIPLSTYGQNGQLIDIGLCFQAGTAPSHGQCDPDAGRDNMSGLCPVNQLCSGVQPDPADANKQLGECIEMCNGAPDPAVELGCDSGNGGGDFCLDVSGVDYDNPNWQTQARIGFCFDGCNPFGSDACPQDGLGNDQGCWLGPDLDENGYCTALMPDAPGVGESCTPIPSGTPETRMECADRLVCLPMNQLGTVNACVGWCDMRQCNFLESCSGCAGAACEACTPACTTGQCGDDGCGGTCPCESGEVCNAGTCETCPTDGTCSELCPCAADSFCDSGTCAACTVDGACVADCGCAAGEFCDAGTCTACPTDGSCTDRCGCADGEVCNAGTCCTPTCDGINCLDVNVANPQTIEDFLIPDGCGGFCGCAAGEVCGNTGTCTACVPDCRFKSCGDDGCGGSCGDCQAGEACSTVSTDQGCLFVDDPQDPATQPLGICSP